MDKLLLIDGHSILNRAFYGVPLFANTKGVHTNAVFGFLNMMFKFIDDEMPTHIAVAFDVHKPTFRHEMFKEYKGTRKPMLPELREQVPIIKELLNKMNITVMELPGYEADDVIGTMSKRGEAVGMEVCVYSGDRDLLQLASDNITICIPKTKKGQTTIERYNADQVKKLYKVTPTEFIDVKALMGDSSDNIPGVPGIGEKGATSIIEQFGSIENAYSNAEQISNTRNKNALLEHYDMAQMSKTLATININSPVAIEPKSCTLDNIYTELALDMIKELELKSIISRFSDVSSSNDIEDSFMIVTDIIDAEEIFAKAKCKTNGLYVFKPGTLYGVGICYDKTIAYIKVGDFITEEYVKSELSELVKTSAVYTVNIKENNEYFNAGDNPEYEKLEDLSLISYLINPIGHSYSYDDFAREYMEINVPTYDEIFPKTTKKEIPSIDICGNAAKYACYNAYVFLNSFEPMLSKLKEMSMEDIYYNMEKPLTYALYEMEQCGIKVDASELKTYSDELAVNIQNIEQKIYKEAGHEFNINSPKQLGDILFGEMGIPGGKKTKTGYSTSASVLEKLEPDYPFVKDVLKYRQFTKLKSTYADGLINYIKDDGRIYGKFNQTITATGRISSTEPNLQNIPVRTELGRKFRKVFIPKDGYTFVDADYSQIELRILAHMSDDEKLIKAYKESKDIHTATAALVFNVPIDQVTKTQRSNAKAVNFGIVYGISSFGLSQDLSITRKEAQEYINNYFESYPGIKKYLDAAVLSAKEKGYSITMFGRRRPIPELKVSNFMQRQFGERVAMNAPIQGTAADIMKIAMINVNRVLKNRGLESRIVLQVHDELLIEAKNEEKDIVAEILVEEMSKAATLHVPLKVDVETGSNWDEAH
jgi:DNA polymerase-1